jgi:hypothetical protein
MFMDRVDILNLFVVSNLLRPPGAIPDLHADDDIPPGPQPVPAYLEQLELRPSSALSASSATS